jgi:hypothetical protein
MPINLKPILKPSNFFAISFFITFIFSVSVFAQLPPIGLYEGLMGNSGVALSDSTASSYYNPSLLNQKKKSSFSFGGNTLSNLTTESEVGKISAAKLAPSYISSVQAFDNFVHEFFLINVISLQTRYFASEPPYSTDINLKSDVFYAGYSFAFNNFPMGFQAAVRSIEISQFGFTEARDATKALTAKIESSFKKIDLLLNISGHHEFKNYGFGYKYVSRGVKLTENRSGSYTQYIYDSGANSYAIYKLDYQPNVKPFSGDFISIGHSFKMGSNEFLTDTNFEERDDLTHSYNWSQTFGYKVTSEKQHQFLCGLSHLINKDVKYFGQSAYFSVGYSWLTNANRSAVGMYYSADRVTNDTRSYGLTFSSEFIY